MSSNLTTIRRSVQTAACLALLLVSAACAQAQGTFQNLNFERATVPPTPGGGYGGEVDPGLAFPGWTVSVVWAATNTYGFYTLYNNKTLDSPAVDLIGPSFPNGLGLSSLQGSYSVALQYSAFFNAFPFLSQTGLVPLGARSISILVPSGTEWWQWPSVNLNGVRIPLTPLGNGRVGGDVSAFAGSPADLTFSTGAYFSLFDDIRFSTQVIPEPGILSLASLGALLSGSRALYRRYQISAANKSIQRMRASRSGSLTSSTSSAAGSHR
jgi:hypothetical protein